MGVNITEVRLCAVPLENDYKHTIYFVDEYTQRNYFIGKTVHSGANFSYQRKDNVIRYPKHFDELQNCNYVMYKNSAYTEKWFYAFITEMEYINDEMTAIRFETDVMQTYMFDYTVLPSFVEREHCAEDAVGSHTIDEGLELGEYTCNRHSRSDYGSDGMSIVIGITKTPDKQNVSGTMYNNMYSGVQYRSFSPSKVNEVISFLSQYDSDGLADSVVCMFMSPVWLAPIREDHGITATAFIRGYYINSDSIGTAGVEGVHKELTPGDLDGYTPRNKKLLTFPFRYLHASNNAGGSAVYKYERFKKTDGNNVTSIVPPCFIIEGVLTPGCSVRMTPLYYNGIYRNDEHGLNMGKFPILNWTSDVYTNWLTQNGVNIAIDLVAGAAQTVAGVAMVGGSGGLATALGGGSIVGGVNQIANTIGQIHQMSFAPPQAKGNLNSGDVVTASDSNDFHFYDMTIKKEYARIIDEYFDMFGYKCNRVKTPAKNHRQRWWYTKTIDVSIDGAIPMKDMQTIKNCYNNGITFWRHTVDIGAYKDRYGTPYDNGEA